MPRVTRQPYPIENPAGYIATWKNMLPPPPPPKQPVKKSNSFRNTKRAYKLSLLSAKEFTVTAVMHHSNLPGFKPNLDELRVHIEQISRDYGHGARAVFEKEGPDCPRGRWRLHLSCYHAFHSFLCSDPQNVVDGIPMSQLKIVSLGRALADKSFPEPDALVDRGVPAGLARALAPYQRGGVDFALERDGRALIADEMGLGKTIQAIASMACWEEEWPLLVLCPSGARYHWEAEFLHWLGERSPVHKREDNSTDRLRDEGDTDFKAIVSDVTKETLREGRDAADGEHKRPRTGTRPSMRLLHRHEIHVISASKEAILPHAGTRVVICSYGLAPTLVSSEKIRPGQFKCIVADESHMLKNKATKRTKTIIPILKAASRVLMLSGTPALSRPFELYPQLSVLGEKNGWWKDERDFIEKYVKPSPVALGNAFVEEQVTSNSLSELHALLTSTVMIRRVKADILKDLPPKTRICARVTVRDREISNNIAALIQILCQGSGVLARLARADRGGMHRSEGGIADGHCITEEQSPAAPAQAEDKQKEGNAEVELQRRGCLLQAAPQVSPPVPAPSDLKNPVNTPSQNQAGGESLEGVGSSITMRTVGPATTIQAGLYQSDGPEITRKAILNELFCLTGHAKIPKVVEMLRNWVNDPARGKLCIFAHHIFVLDEIVKRAELSNAHGSSRKFIRIDGSTNPKARQEQIVTFQTDPTVRIAILGITAAGVAVTLTAASTVWFAELFWTPAIMIQAEDRCHRIGQQTTVKCMYLIAKGTLDELLWKLIEKKFQDLGEFVEGKEKQKIVVDHLYDDEDSSTAEGPGKSMFFLAEVANEEYIQADIKQLAMEEQAMVKISADDEDEDGKIADQNEELIEEPTNIADILAACKTGGLKDMCFPALMQLPRAVWYRMYFDGPSIGLAFASYQGRVVVTKVYDDFFSQGLYARPAVGDVLLSINRSSLPLSMRFADIAPLLKSATKNPITEMVFAKDEEFRTFFFQVLASHPEMAGSSSFALAFPEAPTAASDPNDQAPQTTAEGEMTSIVVC